MSSIFHRLFSPSQSRAASHVSYFTLILLWWPVSFLLQTTHAHTRWEISIQPPLFSTQGSAPHFSSSNLTQISGLKSISERGEVNLLRSLTLKNDTAVLAAATIRALNTRAHLHQDAVNKALLIMEVFNREESTYPWEMWRATHLSNLCYEHWTAQYRQGGGAAVNSRK